MTIHPWLAERWQRLAALGERLPHALLFVGPAGLGKRALADAFAARLLCAAPQADGHACGQCAACRLRLSGNHPDLLTLVPAANAADGGDGSDNSDNSDSGDSGGAAAGAGSGEESPAGGKKKSSQIVIEQIRDLQQTLSVTGHQSARRVVVVDPAEAMNVFTANALLKLLEEPPEGCVFMLVSSAPRRLLPTVRSRCQQWRFTPPAAGALAQWLASEQGASAQPLLAVNGGMPLAAERMAAQGLVPFLARFATDVSRMPNADPLVLAGQWEAWLKSREAGACGFGLVLLVDWMQRWVTDLAAVRLGARARYFPAQQAALAALAARTSVAVVLNCYNDFTRIRRVAQHPLNLRLMLEDMLLRYKRAVTGPRP